MAIQKDEAVILKVGNFRETSIIVELFTKEFGKISGLIKGIRKAPQRYGGIPLVFSRMFVVFYESRKKELNLVTQCDPQEHFQLIRENWEKTNYAVYFTELLDAVTQPYDKNTALFNLISAALNALSEQQQNWPIARIFEIKLLNLSGFKPRLDACVSCQKTIAGNGKFSPSAGGILCVHCSRANKEAQPIMPGTIASINYIEKSGWQKALQLKMPRKVAQELSAILGSFLESQLEKKINARKFLELKQPVW